eukprot:TRINITY_DN4483_c0_g1_i1.p1 TRINITY_DN4483_c0_g1~~TRINITY_DN4483_c0_g1_i1.p1  ORF type:complete len:341 (+),score=70.62 TRINITY_DN4483_c0_g1_i1:63-1085(+)
MAFNESAFVSRLDALSTSQDSIETMSLWMRHHRIHALQVVNVWLEHLKTAKKGKQLKYIFLASDVLLFSLKQQHTEFILAFKHVLSEALAEVYPNNGSKGQKQIDRILAIWKERELYPSDIIDTFTSGMHVKKAKKETRLRPEDLSTPVDRGALIRDLAQLERSLKATRQLSDSVKSLPSTMYNVDKAAAIDDYYTLQEQLSVVTKAKAASEQMETGIETQMKQHDQLYRWTCYSTLQRLIKQEQFYASECQDKLESVKEQLAQLTAVRNELKTHVANLPDDDEETTTDDAAPTLDDIFGDDGDNEPGQDETQSQTSSKLSSRRSSLLGGTPKRPKLSSS